MKSGELISDEEWWWKFKGRGVSSCLCTVLCCLEKNKIRKGRGRNVCVWECGVCVSCVRRVSCVLVVWAWEEGGGI